ncbi:MAG TPA: hypothetical protein ENN30_02125 [Candidatus Woesearchaeota archaeon]|nr:hypothetical protein [Candidatus Woesearchaeota archaeon]
MKLINIAALCIALVSIAFAFGCTTETQELAVEESPEIQTVSSGIESLAVVDSKPVEKIYACPLDLSKVSYNCETDDDCKMVGCRGGAGEIYTCVGVSTEYEGAKSSECACKSAYSYTTIDTKGNEVTEYVKTCKRI